MSTIVKPLPEEPKPPSLTPALKVLSLVKSLKASGLRPPRLSAKPETVPPLAPLPRRPRAPKPKDPYDKAAGLK